MTLPLLTRRHFIAASGTAAAALPFAPGMAHAAGGTVRVRAPVDIQTLDPAFTYTNYESNLNRALLLQLIAWTTHMSWDWEKDAAAMIEQVDPTHVKFALRDDIGWNNGFGPVTAEDVKFSFERIIDPGLASPYSADWAALDRIEVTGEREGVIVMKQPFAPLWLSTLPGISGFILCKKAVEALPGARVETEMPAVAGPYKVKEWLPKQKMTIVPNESFTMGKAAYDEMVFYPVDDDRVAELAFEAGEYDYCAVSVSSVPALREKRPEGSILLECAALDYYWLGMNTEHANFQDRRVRQAVQYAVDVPAVLEAAFFGVVERATGFQTKGSMGYRERNIVAERDVEKAKALMAEAGVEGFKATITLVNTSLFTSMAQVIQANLAEIGIEVEILPYDSGTFWNLGLESEGETYKDLQMFLHQYTGLPDPNFQTQWFVPEQVGVWNWERWNSPEYKALNEQQLSEFDEAKRGAIVQKMQDLMEESGAYLFLTNSLNPVLYRDTLSPCVLPSGNNLYFPGFKPA